MQAFASIAGDFANSVVLGPKWSRRFRWMPLSANGNNSAGRKWGDIKVWEWKEEHRAASLAAYAASFAVAGAPGGNASRTANYDGVSDDYIENDNEGRHPPHIDLLGRNGWSDENNSGEEAFDNAAALYSYTATKTVVKGVWPNVRYGIHYIPPGIANFNTVPATQAEILAIETSGTSELGTDIPLCAGVIAACDFLPGWVYASRMIDDANAGSPAPNGQNYVTYDNFLRYCMYAVVRVKQARATYGNSNQRIIMKMWWENLGSGSVRLQVAQVQAFFEACRIMGVDGAIQCMADTEAQAAEVQSEHDNVWEPGRALGAYAGPEVGVDLIPYPVSYRAEGLLALLQQPHDEVWLGDSITVAWLPQRSWQARVAVNTECPRVSGVYIGCAPGSTGLIGHANNFSTGTGAWTRCENANGWSLDNGVKYALPAQLGTVGDPAGTTLTTVKTGAQYSLATFEVRPAWFNDWANTQPLREGSERLNWRIFYHAGSPVSIMPTAIRVYDDDGNNSGQQNMRTGARRKWEVGGPNGAGATPAANQSNVIYQDFALTGATSPDKATWTAAGPTLSLVVRTMGLLAQRDGEELDGTRYLCLADSSFDLAHLAATSPSDGTSKDFDEDQLYHHLDGFVDDRDRPVIFLLHYYTEDRTEQALRDRLMGSGSFDGCIPKIRAVCARLGVTNYRIVLLGCWGGSFSGKTYEESDAITHRNHKVFYDIATEEEDVIFISLWGLLGWNRFQKDDPLNLLGNGPVPTGVQARAKGWLRANGGDALVTGTHTTDLTDATWDGVLHYDGTHQSHPTVSGADVFPAAALPMLKLSEHVFEAAAEDMVEPALGGYGSRRERASRERARR